MSKRVRKTATRKSVAAKKKSSAGKTASAKKNPTAQKGAAGKKKTTKREARNEFRYNNTTKHPNYIFEAEGEKYHAVGITHQSKTFGRDNMPLKSNPQKGKTDPAYIRNGIITDKKRNFSNLPQKNMSFEESDFKNVKSKVRNYKKRRKKKTND